MRKPKRPWREERYASQRNLTLENRLFVLLRDELGLESQPKVARLLASEIMEVVRATIVDAHAITPGQLILMAVELGQGPSWDRKSLAEKKTTPVRLTLIAKKDIERLIAGEDMVEIRTGRMIRMIHEAIAQGAALTVVQLALMTGISANATTTQLRKYMKRTGDILPLRGIVEDCSSAVSHKIQIVNRHLAGQTTAEISRDTNHTPKSVERYIKRFEQIRELVRYLDKTPEPAVIARILGCSMMLVNAYLELLPPGEKRGPSEGSTAG